MEKQSTADRLKTIMKERDLRQVDILNAAQPYCAQYNIKLGKNDLSQYVNGKVIPGQEKLTVLGRALGVSEVWLMGYDVPKEPLVSPPSPKLIDISNLPRDLLEIDERLNSAGHNEWVNYGTFLTGQDEYKRPAGVMKKAIRHYLVPAAAGYASPIDGEDYEIIELEDVPPGADFCLTVQGDSMEPYIKDGSYVFVSRSADLHDFDVGVFYLDGDVYIKQVVTDAFRNTYLLSANPRREDANKTVMHDSDSTLVCYGKVLINKLPQPRYY